MNAFLKVDSVPGIRQSVMYGVGHITYTYGKISLPENKTRTAESWNADCTAVTTTTTLSPRSGKLCSFASLWCEERTTKSVSVLQNRIYTVWTHPKSLLPTLLSLFPASNQPSFSGPCASCCLLAVFFPVLIFFSSSFLSVDSASGVEKWSGDGHHCPLSSTLAWKGHIWHSCLTEATKASKETGALWLTVAWFVSACDLSYCDSVDFNGVPQWFHLRSFEMSHTQSSYSGSESGQVEKEPFQISFWMYMVEVLLKFPV